MARTVPKQRPLEPGELYRRLNALGWSGRAFAAGIGEHEGRLRDFDRGTLPSKPALVELRAKILAWIDAEERHRAKHPMPRKAGSEPVGVTAKRRRRQPLGVSDASEAAQDFGSGLLEGMREAVAWKRGEAPDVSEHSETDTGHVLRFEVPDLGPLPRLVIGPDEPVDAEMVTRIVECTGMPPKEIAERMDAPAVQRTIRRWMKGRDRPKLESSAWLREVAAVLAQYPEVTAWVRTYGALRQWRHEAGRQLNEVVEAHEALEPPGLAEWEAAVDAVLKRRPVQLAAYQHRGLEEAPVAVSGRRVGPESVVLRRAGTAAPDAVLGPDGGEVSEEAAEVLLALGTEWTPWTDLRVSGAFLNRLRRRGLIERGSRPDAAAQGGFEDLYRLTSTGHGVKAALLARGRGERSIVERREAETALRAAAERAAAARDPSEVPDVSRVSLAKAHAAVMQWIGMGEIPEDDQAHQDGLAALVATHEPGMSIRRWVTAAEAWLERDGYEIDEGDDEPEAAPAAVVEDRRGPAEARPRLGLQPGGKRLVDLTRGEG